MSNDTEAFDALIHAVALQLLASCHTSPPASSANHPPLSQQNTSPKLVTALQAHSSFHFSPATSHHARSPSKTFAQPGLHRTSRQRRCANNDAHTTPTYSERTAGRFERPNSPETHLIRISTLCTNPLHAPQQPPPASSHATNSSNGNAQLEHRAASEGLP